MSSLLAEPSARLDCSKDRYRRIVTYYRLAYRYTRAANQLMAELALLPQQRRRTRWNNQNQTLTSPARWFGPYDDRRFEHVRLTYQSLLERFERGYWRSGRFQAVRVQCLKQHEGRCNVGVLANARVYGTVKVCPRLLSKPTWLGATVIMHEMLHQLHNVGDQRHDLCARSDDNRCYRLGALKLVRHSKLRLAIDNNDNYAYFATATYARSHSAELAIMRHRSGRS